MKKFFKTTAKWLWRLFLILLVILGISMVSCSLPSLQDRTQSNALPSTQIIQTTLGKKVLAEQNKHPNVSGIYFLKNAHEAFAARGKLAQEAEKTLDVQYYIWKNDTTGILLLQALHEAANRGVKVRLLLDDNGTSDLDSELFTLHQHPNIEIRLFNPFLFRPFKQIGFVTDFSRSNRRMHNKTFTADNIATILGGRNIGDEYFGATEGVLFADLDAIVMGDIVKTVSDSFDEYWNSPSSYPVDLIVKNIDLETQKQVLNRIVTNQNQTEAQNYLQLIHNMKDIESIIEQDSSKIHWVPTKFIADPATKGLKNLPYEQLLLHNMEKTIGNARQQLDIVSPYFVPTETGTDYFVNLAKQGVKVRILTNSMAATDVLPVHSGYAKYRKRLVDAGIELYEMKPDPASSKFADQVGIIGSSGSSLHAKTFCSDSLKFFIGSFNFDPRSASLNTELGIVIDDALIGADLNDMFINKIRSISWQVKKDDATGELRWHDLNTGEILTEEPHSNWWNRSLLSFLSILPIEPLL